MMWVTVDRVRNSGLLGNTRRVAELRVANRRLLAAVGPAFRASRANALNELAGMVSETAT